MTLEQLQNIIDKKRLECEIEIDKAIKTYCECNNPFKIGDIIDGKFHTIVIQKIEFTKGDMEFNPQCLFIGSRLVSIDGNLIKTDVLVTIKQSEAAKISIEEEEKVKAFWEKRYSLPEGVLGGVKQNNFDGSFSAIKKEGQPWSI